MPKAKINGRWFETEQRRIDITLAGHETPQYMPGLIRCKIDGAYVNERDFVEALRQALGLPARQD